MFKLPKLKVKNIQTAKPTLNKGLAIENLVKKVLEKKGLQFITQNYHSRFGEIDLVFIEPFQTLLFIEVRYRANASHGTGAETVSRLKQSKIIKTAQHFLQKEAEYAHFNCRFDVISVCQTQELNENVFDQVYKDSWLTLDKILSYQWLKDAFQASAW